MNVKTAAILFGSVALISLSMIPSAAAGPITVKMGPAGAVTNFKPAASVSNDNIQTFNNDDTVNHHPVADDSCFDTGVMAPGSTVDADLSGCGDTIAYHCAIHALTMHGVIRKI